MILIHVGGR